MKKYISLIYKYYTHWYYSGYARKNATAQQKYLRCEQDSNLRGNIPLDFESNALTTRPSQLLCNVFDVFNPE